MGKVIIDETAWPLIHIRWPRQANHAEMAEHFDEIEALLARGQIFAAVADVDAIRDQTVAQRTYAAARLARFASRARGTVAAVAHVADHWLARAVLTTVFWMSPAPFPMRDFRTHDAARAWANDQLLLALRHGQPRDLLALEASEI